MIKRLLDLSSAILGLSLLSPLMLVTAVMIRLRMGGPVFFIQERPGMNGKPFKMVKFRTMLDTQDANGNLLKDSDRLTSFGRFLRSSSIDELPELWNVLKGDMSIVGPRPLLMEYLPRYSTYQARRHEVRPGVTGWAQINGRNAISWEEKFKLDVWYVDNRTLSLDLTIVFRTLQKVVKREGISAAGEATMSKFGGE